MSLPNVSNVLRSIRQHSCSLGTSLALLLLISAGLFFYWTLTKPVTLTIFVQALEAQRWRPLIQEFEKIQESEKKFPKIHIEMVEGSDATDALEEVYAQSFEQEANWLEKLYASVFGRREQHYDLVYMDIIWVARFADKGWLMPLSEDKVSKEEQKGFLLPELEGGKYKGKLYRLPFHSDVGVLYYRKDLLNDKGLKPPTTFDELKSISNKLKDPQEGRFGYIWQGQEYEGLVAMFIEVLYGYGGFWIKTIDSKTKTVGLDQPEATEAVKFLRSTIDQGISPKSVSASREDATSIMFQKGEAVFLRNWPNVRSFSTSDSPIRGKVGIVPMVHAQGQESKACQGGWGLGISKFTKHPKEALEAIKFFTNADNQRRYALSAGSMPSRRSLFNDPLLVERYSYFPMLLEILENNTVLRPSIHAYHDVSKILQKHLYDALARPKKVSEREIKDIMTQAADETDQCLKEPTECKELSRSP